MSLYLPRSRRWWPNYGAPREGAHISRPARRAFHEEERVIACNELRSALASDIVPAPVEHHDKFVLQPNHVVDVDEQPEQPGGQATDMQGVQFGHCGVTANDGQIPTVAVAKGRGGFFL